MADMPSEEKDPICIENAAGARIAVDGQKLVGDKADAHTIWFWNRVEQIDKCSFRVVVMGCGGIGVFKGE